MTFRIDVLHHWLAATVIANPLTIAMPPTHIPSPLRKLASLGTVLRTSASPPASQAQPARALPPRAHVGVALPACVAESGAWVERRRSIQLVPLVVLGVASRGASDGTTAQLPEWKVCR